MAKNSFNSAFKTDWIAKSEVEKILIDSLNQHNRGKRNIVFPALMAFFLPEVAYEEDCVADFSKEIRQSLCLLESRLVYLRSLVGDMESLSKAPTSLARIQAATPVIEAEAEAENEVWSSSYDDEEYDDEEYDDEEYDDEEYDDEDYDDEEESEELEDSGFNDPFDDGL